MYKINLLPPELLPEPPARKPFVPKSLLAGVCILGLVYIGLTLALYYTEARIEDNRRALGGLDAKIQEVEVLQNEAAKLETRLSAWQGLLAGRRESTALLNTLQASLPVEMWLTRVEALGPSEQAAEGNPQEGAERLVIEGGSRSLAAVGVYVNRLSGSPYLRRVVFKEVKEVKRAGEAPILVFSIEAVLKEGGVK